MLVSDYEKLLVWQKSMDLVVLVYSFVKDLPKEETYSLKSQMCRAAVSIPSNIAEGSRRRTAKDFCNFLVIALGSASELETQLKITRRLGYGNDKKRSEIEFLLVSIMKILNKLIENKSSAI